MNANVMASDRGGTAASWLFLSAVVVVIDQLSPKSYIAQHFGEFEFISRAAGARHYADAQRGRGV